ncbi:MAG: septum formation initiator family protein [Akkermansia sp.]
MSTNTQRNKRQRSLEQMQGIEREERNHGLERIYFLLIVLLFISICVGVSAFLLPPHTELASLREELEAKREQVARAKAKEEQARAHLKWLEDPEYAEQIARDQANQAMEGETIIRPKPAEPSKPEPKPTPEPR